MKPARRHIETASPRLLVARYRNDPAWYILTAADHRRCVDDPHPYPTMLAAIRAREDLAHH